MPGTYSQILLHVLFSTKQRRPYIMPDIQARLYDYVGGIIRAEKGTLYAIGGMPDPLHMLLRWRTDGAISDLMRTVKELPRVSRPGKPGRCTRGYSPAPLRGGRYKTVTAPRPFGAATTALHLLGATGTGLLIRRSAAARAGLFIRRSAMETIEVTQ